MMVISEIWPLDQPLVDKHNNWQQQAYQQLNNNCHVGQQLYNCTQSFGTQALSTTKRNS